MGEYFGRKLKLDLDNVKFSLNDRAIMWFVMFFFFFKVTREFSFRC